MTDPSLLQVQSALTPEDVARRDFYALLARLFFAGPDRALLDAVAALAPDSSDATDGGVANALAALADASLRADADEEHQRFDDLFIGAGKAPVTLYVSHYLVESGREKILVRLRDDLAAFGLARKGVAREPEDHIAGLCDLMRHLVDQGSGEASLARQREIFERYLARSITPLCDAILAHADRGSFLEAVAHLAKAFLVVEAEGFSMLG
ncbi:MAG: molecular chaperone [Burkholderiales bacterium]